MIRLLYLRPNSPLEEIGIAEGNDRQDFELKLLLGQGTVQRRRIIPFVEILANEQHMRMSSEPNFTFGELRIYGPAIVARKGSYGALVDLTPEDVMEFKSRFTRLIT